MEKFRRRLFGGIRRGVGGGSLNDSGSVVWFNWVRASKGTRRSGAEAVPRMSPGSRSQYPVRGIVCRLEATKYSEGYWPSWVVIISII